MWHRHVFTPVVAAALLVAVGCTGREPTSAAAVQSGDMELSFNAGNPVVFSALGSGQSQGPGIGSTEIGWRTFTFNALQRLDGSTTGNIQYDTHDQGDPLVTHSQQGRVFCMADIGNGLVAIGAEGTKRTPDDQPPFPLEPLGVPRADRPNGNHGLLWVVRDNGEGPNATGPDQFTGVVHTTIGFVTGVCALGAGHPLVRLAPGFLNDVEAGNIQVTRR